MIHAQEKYLSFNGLPQDAITLVDSLHEIYNGVDMPKVLNDFDKLIKTSVSLKNYLDSVQIAGIDELKMDVDLQNPELTLTIDRERALIEGVSTAQVGMQIRTALFGKEVSKIKDGKDEYKIQLRNEQVQRKNLVDLLNMRLSFRDMAAGGIAQGVGHLGGYSDGGRLLKGPGDGMSDNIPATIAGKQPARLADGEFVVPARIVSELGNGSTEAGARKLYDMMDRIKKARRKAKDIAADTKVDRFLPR